MSLDRDDTSSVEAHRTDRIETVHEIDTDMSTDDRYGEDDEYRDETYAETYDENAEAYAEDDDSWWDEGLIGMLLIAGVVLFFIPEPTTSAIGIALIGVAVVAWIVDLIV